MKKIKDFVLVDTGVLLVADKSYYTKNSTDVEVDKLLDRKAIKVELENGTYEIEYKTDLIRYNNDSDEESMHSRDKKELVVTSGVVYVVDPGYIFYNEDWIKVLEKTDYHDRLPENAIRLGTVYDKGTEKETTNLYGDGEYRVELNFKKIK